MAGISASLDIQMQLAGSAGAWTSVGADVMLNPPVVCSYGIRGTGPTDRVAATGTLGFALDNSAQNSAKTLGYYSPTNANCRAGFDLGIGVRAALSYSGSTFYKFVGSLEDIGPVPGQSGVRITYCQAVDWMDEAAKQKLSLVTTQVNQTGDKIISAVVSGMTRKPAASALNAGDDIFPYALDNNQNSVDTPMTVFQNIANSELGFIYLKGDQNTGGVLTFLDRHGRPSIGTSSGSFNATMANLTAKRSRANLYNDVKTVVHPRRADVSASILFKLNMPQQITAGCSIIIQGNYTDPSGGNAIRAGLLTACNLTANTDYTANTASDGTGADFTGTIVFSTSFGANSFQVSASSTTAVQNFWLTKFQLRGIGLYDYGPVTLESIDANSSACYGTHVLPLDMPYQSDATGVGRDAADYLKQVWSQPATRIEMVNFIGNVSDALMTAGLAREISDRVTIIEKVTGLNNDFYIQGIDWSLDGMNTFHYSWLLAPTDPYAYWLIGVVGSGEIGVATRVGY